MSGVCSLRRELNDRCLAGPALAARVGEGNTCPCLPEPTLQSRAEFLPSRSFIRSGKSPVGAFCWKSPKDVDYAWINIVRGGGVCLQICSFESLYEMLTSQAWQGGLHSLQGQAPRLPGFQRDSPCRGGSPVPLAKTLSLPSSPLTPEPRCLSLALCGGC